MPLILAIEPDRRQAAQLSVVVRKRVHAELILVETTERALDAIGNRMPDLVLVPALLSPQDDAALAAALRVIAAAARVQMLTIPVLGTPRPAASPGGMLSALRRGKQRSAEPDGCDPAVFAEQIASYLERAAQEHATAGAERVAAPTAPVDRPAPIEEPNDAFAIAGLSREPVAEPAREPVEEAVSQEWLDPLPAEVVEAVAEPAASETPVAAAPDESVSFALVEAVRALFADSPPPAVDAEPEPPAEIFPEAAMVAADTTDRTEPARVERAETVAKKNAEKDEWDAVEELIAALQLMPLSAIEVTSEDDWIGPVAGEPQRGVEQPKYAVDTEGEPAAAPSGAKSEREWVALIESLRHDVERLRVERSEKPGGKAAAAAAAAATAARPDRPAKPVQDEWGFFDPQQCGFAALLAKLDEVTDSDDGRINH